MTPNQDPAALQTRVAELERQLAEAKSIAATLYHALNNAATVVDAGANEDYAYRSELEAGAELLGIKRGRFEPQAMSFEEWCLSACKEAGVAVPTGLASEAALIVEKMAPTRRFRFEHSEQQEGSQMHKDWILSRLKGAQVSETDDRSFQQRERPRA